MERMDEINDGRPLPPPSNRFSSVNQPPPEAKSNGHKKRFRSALLVRAILERRPQGRGWTRLIADAARYFDIPETDVDLEVLMIYKMVCRAIKKDDVAAFNAVMDRAYGKPLLRINEEWTPPETAGLKLTNGREITL